MYSIQETELLNAYNVSIICKKLIMAKNYSKNVSRLLFLHRPLWKVHLLLQCQQELQTVLPIAAVQSALRINRQTTTGRVMPGSGSRPLQRPPPSLIATRRSVARTWRAAVIAVVAQVSQEGGGARGASGRH